MQNKRRENMDGLLLCGKLVEGQQIRLAAVCDGVGSTSDGAYAAARVLAELKEWFESLQSRDRIGIVFLKQMQELSETVSKDIERLGLNAATTLSALILTEETYYIVHAGDSRIYGWDGDHCVQLTQDCVQDGRLCSYIGCRGSAEFEYCEGRNASLIYMLCSDGLYKRMDAGFICARLKKTTVRNMEKTENALADYVIAKGERDNITVALMMNKGWREK